METKEITKEQMIRLKAHFTKKYGIELDEWFSTVMFEMNEINQESKASMNLAIQKIDSAAKLIKGQMRTVQFVNNKQAFCYGLGQYLIFGLTTLFLIIIVFWSVYINSTFKAKSDFITKYPSVEKFENVYQNAKTISKDGYEYMVFYPMKNNEADFATGYIFDNKNKRVLIPIRAN